MDKGREIKFRAKIKDEFLGLFYMMADGWYYWDLDSCISRDKKYLKLETVSQFTGLRDKNGVDVYEGHIVGFSDVSVAGTKTHAPIIWDEETLSYKVDIGYKHRTLKEGEKDKTLEVIGDIYTNPEVIKQTNEENISSR